MIDFAPVVRTRASWRAGLISVTPLMISRTYSEGAR
jgi:hypothetical protein